MEGKMHAIVMHGPNDYAYEEVDIPQLGAKEVLVKIKAVSICGSDPKVFDGGYLSINWPPSFPFTPGHEFSGEVAEIGPDVTEFAVGDRVAGEAHCGCGNCANCKKGMYNLCLNYGKTDKGHRHYGFTYRGAYADYNAYNVKALTKIPDNVSFEEASLADTAGTSLQALRLTGIVPDGYTVVIGPGPIGMFCMQLAKAMGSKTVMVGRGRRLELAGELGADYLINFETEENIVQAIRDITGGIGVDQAFDAAGTKDSLAQCIFSARKDGQVACVALPTVDMHELPVKTMVMNQIHVHGSRANPNCCAEVLQYMSEGKINAAGLITHVIPLSDFHHAMEVFTKRLEGAMKVVVIP
ncbi:MAG: zinc-dependent alcohol dehydrogenase [Lachnospiraceae bacterium]|jgi:L-iditol 2-dehydrogenase